MGVLMMEGALVEVAVDTVQVPGLDQAVQVAGTQGTTQGRVEMVWVVVTRHLAVGRPLSLGVLSLRIQLWLLHEMQVLSPSGRRQSGSTKRCG